MATNEYIGNGKEKVEFHCKGKVLCLPLCELRPGSTSHRVPPVRPRVPAAPGTPVAPGTIARSRRRSELQVARALPSLRLARARRRGVP